jgi:endonuclease III
MTKSQKNKPVHTADEFGLDVLSGDDDMFRWFLLSYLFGKPIQSSVAVRTWKLFLEKKLDTPWAIVDMSHRKLIQLLDEGRYARYDETTARGLQICMKQLIRDYEGSLVLMIDSSDNENEFSARLQKLYGIGPKTAEIIMRETTEVFARRVE